MYGVGEAYQAEMLEDLKYIYLYMDALIIYPENKEQLSAIKAVMKAMKVVFEERSNVYPEHVINGVKESVSQAEGGELSKYTGIRDMLGK